ncbi:MAG: hypothetical protein HY290_17065 [Planctomycetia bacterium]|nr:hypothetical protein [Planctomycetia bacterium]
MSDHAAPAATATTAETTTSSPEFDQQELAMFGKDDGHAVTVIGKMLVGFFFYSLIVMSIVAFWTMGRGGQVPDHPAQDSHAEDVDE